MWIVLSVLYFALGGGLPADDASRRPVDDLASERAEPASDADRSTCDEWGVADSCYDNGTDCYGVVLMCNSCCYDENGIFEEETSDACGACLGVPF
jgi:hypothetical protein